MERYAQSLSYRVIMSSPRFLLMYAFEEQFLLCSMCLQKEQIDGDYHNHSFANIYIFSPSNLLQCLSNVSTYLCRIEYTTTGIYLDCEANPRHLTIFQPNFLHPNCDIGMFY